MSTPATYVGNQYNIPAYQDTGYAQGAGNLSSYLIALATGSLTLSGGTFTLTADVDFGANFGLKSIYYKSRAANLSTVGVVRLGNTEVIGWRNAANGANLSLTATAGNYLSFDGSGLVLTATANQMVIGTTNTTTISFTAPAASRTYTVPDVLGAADFILTAGAQTISGAKTFQDQKLLLQETGGTDVVTINVAALGASRAYTIPDAGASASFVMTVGAQTITGAKTFASSALLLQENGGTDVATIAVAALASGLIYTVPDAGGAASFVMTAGTQTIAGATTFSSALTINPASNQLVLGVTNTVTISATAPSASRVYTLPDAGGNVNITYGSAWASYTPASSWVANTTVTGKWRRVGDSIDLDIKVACSGAPTAATLTVDLPSGLTIDTAKLVDNVAAQTMIGLVEIIDAGVAFYTGMVLYSDTDTLTLRYMDDAAAAVTLNTLTQAAPIAFGNGDYVLVKVTGLPISGWGA